MRPAAHEPIERLAVVGAGAWGTALATVGRRAGRTVSCPMLCLWSLDDDLERLYGDILAVWRPWAPDLRGHGIRSGHHMAEEAPEDLADALLRFLSEAA